jgi:anion-transporting  ArsA/GET3 family ATPase
VDVAGLLRSTDVRFVVGKGGVGKTTVTAALALAGARAGLTVLVVELERRPELARCFGGDGALELETTTLFSDRSGGGVLGRHVAPDAALVEWLSDHGMRRLVNKMRSTGALDVVSTAVPGIRDVLILGKIKALANHQVADVVLVDAPATGHSLSLLAAPASLMAAARSGPIRRQAEDADRMLRDESRCAVTLVTMPTELAVAEAVEAAFDIEDRAGVALSGVVVNQVEGAEPALARALDAVEVAGLGPDLIDSIEAARRFSRARFEEEEVQRRRLSEELPLPQVILSRLDVDVVDLTSACQLANEMRRAEW